MADQCRDRHKDNRPDALTLLTLPESASDVHFHTTLHCLYDTAQLLNAVRMDRVAKVRSLAPSDRTAWAHTFKDSKAPRGHLYGAQHALLASDGLSSPADQACCFVVEMLPSVVAVAAAALASPGPNEEGGEHLGMPASSKLAAELERSSLNSTGINNSNGASTNSGREGGGIVHLHRCSSAEGCAAWVRALEAARLKASNNDDDNNAADSAGSEVLESAAASAGAGNGAASTAAAPPSESSEPSPPLFFENERLPVTLVARAAPTAAMPLWHMPPPAISRTSTTAPSGTSSTSSSTSGNGVRGATNVAGGGDSSESDNDSGSSDSSDSDEDAPRDGSGASSGGARLELAPTVLTPTSNAAPATNAASATAVCVVLELAYAHLLPAPTLAASVCGSKRVADAQVSCFSQSQQEKSITVVHERI